MFASKDDLVHANNDYISPLALFNHITKLFSAQQKYCLFLDIDGTISEFHANPNLSFIAPSILEDIQILKKSGLDVLVVTGRSLEDASRLLSPLDVPIAATHGLEIRTHFDAHIQFPSEYQDFDHVLKNLQSVCLKYPSLRIEQKKYAIALHYREAPHCADIAKEIMDRLNTQYEKLKLNQGKYVYELILKEADKGQAILQFIQQLQLQECVPIFIGDDVTDESGFNSILNLNGISIKVGEGPSVAQYRLKNVTAVRLFIHLFKEFSLIQKNQKIEYLNNKEHHHV